jgi:hypothetical protein
MAQTTTTTESKSTLSTLDKLLLAVPLVAGLFFGLAPLLTAQQFGHVTGYAATDKDMVIYWLAGAGTLCYGIALIIGIREGGWAGMRLPVAAVLGFNASSLFACEEEIRLGRANGHPIVYLILVASIALCFISGFVLARHRGVARTEVDTATWLLIFLIFGVIAAVGSAVLGLFFPEQFHPLFGLDAKDIFIYRQLGAATVGYAVMSILQVRSRRWAELRLSLIMAGLFNGMAVIIGFISVVSGKPPLFPTTLMITPLLLAAGCFTAIARKGK